MDIDPDDRLDGKMTIHPALQFIHRDLDQFQQLIRIQYRQILQYILERKVLYQIVVESFQLFPAQLAPQQPVHILHGIAGDNVL